MRVARVLSHIFFLYLDNTIWSYDIISERELRKTSKRNPTLSCGWKYIHRATGCALSYESRSYCKTKINVYVLPHEFKFSKARATIFAYRSRPVALVVYRLLFGSRWSTGTCHRHFAQRASRSCRVSQEWTRILGLSRPGVRPFSRRNLRNRVPRKFHPSDVHPLNTRKTRINAKSKHSYLHNDFANP